MTIQIKSEATARTATGKPGKNVADIKTTQEGLFMRITANGTKSWRMRSRKTGQVTLGRFPAITFADAKTLAVGLLTDAARRQTNRTVEATVAPTLAVKDRRTLSGLLDQYGADVGHGQASWTQKRDFIEYRYGGHLDKPVGLLTADAILDPVRRDRNVAAKRAARYLTTILRWAGADRGVANGALDELVPEISRTRVLSDDELRAVLDARLHLTPVWRDFVLASVLLMTRRSDHGTAHADHFDLSAGVWNARISKTKGTGHILELMPLSRQALKLLAPRVEAGGEVFGLHSNFHRSLKRLHRLSDTEGWTWHDLRRTSRTLMSRIGVPREIRELCMSHVERDSNVRTYDQHDFALEKQAAFQALADAIDAIRDQQSVSRHLYARTLMELDEA